MRCTAYEIPAYEMHARKMHTRKIHAREMHAHEVHAHETHAHQMHVHEIYAQRQCGIFELGMKCQRTLSGTLGPISARARGYPSLSASDLAAHPNQSIS